MNTTEKAMNKSKKEIEEMYNVLKESIRCFLSRMLIDNEQGNPLKCSYVFGDREAFGLGELQKLHVDKMYQTNEGLIWIHFEGCDEESWSKIDEFSVDDLIDFIHQIEETN
jgi:hypothetical protein